MRNVSQPNLIPGYFFLVTALIKLLAIIPALLMPVRGAFAQTGFQDGTTTGASSRSYAGQNLGSTAATAVPKNWMSHRIENSNGDLLAPSLKNITADPIRLKSYNQNDPRTAFNADMSNTQFAFSTRTSPNVGTFGIKGFTYLDLLSAIYGVYDNHGGFNGHINNARDRTGIGVIRLKLLQNGQGDFSGLWPTCILNSQRTFPENSTNASWNGEPACSIIGGGISAAKDGGYANVMETEVNDNHFDISAAGGVWDLARHNATGRWDQAWFGLRVQSYGTAPVDGMMSAAGPAYVGLHLSDLKFPDRSAAGIATVVNAGDAVCGIGDVLRAEGGAGPKPLRFKVTAVDTSSRITAVEIWQPGLYTEPPANPISTTPEPEMAKSSCIGSSFDVESWQGNAAVALAEGERIYWNAKNPDKKSYPTTVNLGLDWSDFGSSNQYRWFIANRQVLAIVGKGQLTVNYPVLSAASKGQAVALTADGPQKNIDVALLPHGNGSILEGSTATTGGIPEQARCFATGLLSQTCDFVIEGTTQFVGSKRLTTDQRQPDGYNCVPIPPSTTVLVTGNMVLRDVTNGEGEAWRLGSDNAPAAMATRIAAGPVTLQGGDVAFTAVAATAKIGNNSAMMVADAANSCLDVTVVSGVADLRHWAAHIETLQVK